jgi:YesN/AraC family two-component response regulator
MIWYFVQGRCLGVKLIRFFKGNGTGSKVLRIFIPITSIFLIFMFSLAMVFSTLFTNVAQKIIVEDYKSSLEMIGTYYKQLRFTAVPIIDDLFEEEKIQDYLFSKESKEQAMNGCLAKLENAVARNAYVHSVYIYNEDYGFFSSFVGKENPNMLSDSSLLAFLNQHPSNQRLYQRQSVFTNKEILFSREVTLDQQTNLYTICQNSYDENGKLKYGVIMNLSETMARELISSDKDMTIKNFYMIDKEENFISHPDKTQFGSKVADDSLFSVVADFKDSSGSTTIMDSDGKEYLACWFDLNEMNWRLIYLMPMSFLKQPLAKLRLQLVLVFLFFLVLANLLLIWESRRVNSQLSRENRLINYLKGTIDSSSFVYLPNTLFNITLMHLEGTKAENSHTEYEYKNTKYVGYIAKYLSLGMDSKATFLLSVEKNVLVYISAKQDGNLVSKFKKLKIDAMDSMKLSVSILYEEEPVAFENLPEFYNEMKERLFSMIIDTSGFVRSFSKLEEREVNFFLSETAELENTVMRKSAEEYEKAISLMLRNLKNQENYELFCSMKNYLGYSIEGLCSELFKASEILDKEEWKAGIMQSRNYEELKTNLLRISDLFTEYKQQASSKHQDKLVENMKTIIKEHLFDVNLSSTFISDKAGLSLGYARNLFKNNEGIALNDYFGLLRIEEACRQLASTNVSINEIREKLGFSNTSYFCTYFKKMKGMSPTAYRQKNKLPV